MIQESKGVFAYFSRPFIGWHRRINFLEPVRKLKI